MEHFPVNPAIKLKLLPEDGEWVQEKIIATFDHLPKKQLWKN